MLDRNWNLKCIYYLSHEVMKGNTHTKYKKPTIRNTANLI